MCVLTTKFQYCSFFFRDGGEPPPPQLTSRTYTVGGIKERGLSDWGVKFRLLVRASVFVVVFDMEYHSCRSVIKVKLHVVMRAREDDELHPVGVSANPAA